MSVTAGTHDDALVRYWDTLKTHERVYTELIQCDHHDKVRALELCTQLCDATPLWLEAATTRRVPLLTLQHTSALELRIYKLAHMISTRFCLLGWHHLLP